MKFTGWDNYLAELLELGVKKIHDVFHFQPQEESI